MTKLHLPKMNMFGTSDQLSQLLFWYLRQKEDRRLEDIEAILIAGARPQAIETDGLNYLCYAQTKEEIELIVRYGTPIDMQDPLRWLAAIHWHASAVHLKQCEYLAECGADLRLQDREGFDPLSRARQSPGRRQNELVTFLESLFSRFPEAPEQVAARNKPRPVMIRGQLYSNKSLSPHEQVIATIRKIRPNP
jgi:hypothetical protein